METIFFEIGIIIIFASMLALVGRFLRQPLIPMYVVAGIILGPVLSIITNKSVISTLSEIGIAFLLFIVGLEVNFKNLKDVGLVSSIGGIIKSILMFSIGFLVCMILGFESIEAAYMGIALALSSTMVVIKNLSDKAEINTLHGRIIIGILLVEDFIAVLAITFMNSLSTMSFGILLFSFLKGVVLFGLIMLFNKYILKHVFKFAAKSSEILFILSISICFIYGMLFSQFGKILIVMVQELGVVLSPAIIGLLEPGFTIAIGAFIAGISLANLPYRFEISSKIKPLKDFFVTIFFVSLGLEVKFGNLGDVILPLLIFLFVILVIKPALLFMLTFIFGYRQRTSFLTGEKLSQISEFSLIIVTLGMTLGHIGDEIFTITIYLAILTIAATSYLNTYENAIYRKMSGFLKRFDSLPFKAKMHLESISESDSIDVILVGYDRIGYSIFNTLRKLKRKFLVVDFNPEIIRKLIRQGINCIYGDIGDIEVINKLNLKKAKFIISTIPNIENNLLLINKIKDLNTDAVIFVTANHVDEALMLYDEGVDYVILPHFLGGERVSFILEDFTDDISSLSKLIEKKVEHIKELRKRKQMGHYHPINHHIS